jgi:prepilin peptidase CpaA
MPLPTVLACAACLSSVYYDVRWRRIPNAITLPLIVLGPLVACFGGWPHFFSSLGTLAVLLLGGVLLHRTGWLGGGDIKLAIGIGVMLGYPSAVTFLLATGVAGGFIALGVTIARRRVAVLGAQLRSAVSSIAVGASAIAPLATAPADERIPYALAIAAGLIITLLSAVVHIPGVNSL